MKSFVIKSTGIIKKLCWYVCYASMAMIAFMMLLMFVDAMLGLTIDRRITGSYELVQVMLCMVVFFSWAYTQTEHGHIHVIMFVRMMPKTLRFILFGFTSLLSTVTMGLGSYALIGMIQSKLANGECTGTLLIPYWPFYAFEMVAFAVLTLALLCDTVKAFMAIGDDEIAADVMSSWT